MSRCAKQQHKIRILYSTRYEVLRARYFVRSTSKYIFCARTGPKQIILLYLLQPEPDKTEDSTGPQQKRKLVSEQLLQELQPPDGIVKNRVFLQTKGGGKKPTGKTRTSRGGLEICSYSSSRKTTVSHHTLLKLGGGRCVVFNKQTKTNQKSNIKVNEYCMNEVKNTHTHKKTKIKAHEYERGKNTQTKKKHDLLYKKKNAVLFVDHIGQTNNSYISTIGATPRRLSSSTLYS